MTEFSGTELRDRYTVTARYMDGVKVTAYHLVDAYGNGRKVDRNVVAQLALDKLILNVSAQMYNNTIVIKGIKCKLTDLPVIDEISGKIKGEQDNKSKQNVGKYSIIARILLGKSIYGYVLSNVNGDKKKVSRDVVLNLARDGKIINARAQLYGGKMLLRGVGVELAQLPVIRAK